MSIRRLMGWGILVLSIVIGGCAAPGPGDPDPQRENEHALHSSQEHYDRAGAIPPRYGHED